MIGFLAIGRPADIDATQPRLFAELVAAGLPVVAVVGTAPQWTIRLAPGSTPAQQVQADAMATAFDVRPRRPRNPGSIAQDIARLRPQDRETLINQLLAESLRAHPELAVALGIPVPGTEIEPGGV
jgi:hypothetical protein